MRHAMLGMASCALALSLGTGAANAADTGARYTATRAIAVDSATGKYRKPDAAEMTGTAGKTGGITAKLDQSFGGVMLARPRADGSIETRCVFTFEEGAEFLGLVARATK
jgi:hypothetical protein